MALDFRDEWSEYNKYFFHGKPNFVKKIDEMLERRSVKKADAVISVTDGIIDNFRHRYPAEDPGKFVCVTNGFDPEDFEGLDAYRKHVNGAFTITYAGAMNRSRLPASFLQAVKDMIAESPDLSGRIKVVFLGTIEDDVKKVFEDDALKGIVETPGFVNYDETVKRLSRSDALLMIEDQVEIAHRFLSAKLFEYMGIGKPILALANTGNIKRVVEETGIGIVVPPDDKTAINQAIMRLMDGYRSGMGLPTPDMEAIARFHRKNIAKKLSEVLDKISAAKG